MCDEWNRIFLWVTVLSSLATNISFELLTSAKLTDLRFIFFYSPAYAADFLINSEMLHC